MLDCGSDTAAGRAAWDALFAGPLRAARFVRIIVSHAHHDHIGMAGPLARRLAAPVSMSGGEWRTADLRRREPGGPDDSLISYHRSLGRHPTHAPAYITTTAAGTPPPPPPPTTHPH